VVTNDVYGSGRSYEADLLAQARRHARVMQWIAAVSVAVALVFAGMVVVTQSRYTVTSSLITVDKTTGMAEVLSVTNLREIPLQGMEAMGYANKYVTERERYNYGIVQADYNSTIALSTDEVGKGYDKDVRGRVDKLAGKTEEEVRISNVTLPPDQVGRAVVRFAKRQIDATRQEPAGPWRSYIATLAYQFVPSPTGKKETLMLNPLGFKVTAYVVEPELVAK